VTARQKVKAVEVPGQESKMIALAGRAPPPPPVAAGDAENNGEGGGEDL
jgi:hypothetical protein